MIFVPKECAETNLIKEERRNDIGEYVWKLRLFFCGQNIIRCINHGS